jgi:alkanesulfonate monooxygenase
MTLRLYWFLPSHSDGREVGRTASNVRREPDIGYLAQVAQAADRLGFTGALVPFGLFCEDPWLVSAALAGQTSRLRFMIALRSGLASPVLTAQMAASFQRLSGDRLLFNIVVGGDPDEQRRYGDWLAHDERYQRTAEFLDLFRRLWPGRPTDFEGAYYRVKAGLLARPASTPPEIHLGGSSEAARRVAARFADVYLAWGEPPPQLGDLIADVRKRAAEHDREIAVGTRFHVIARDTAEEAWEIAERLVATMDPAMIAKAQERFRRTESEGQRRMAALHGGTTDGLQIYPNVWAGYGLLRPGAGAAIVGSHEEVAERIAEFHELGIEHLILSGQPHLEEAYWFGEGVLPILRTRGLVA